jgi:NitT/TauT family transport system ATP-binding protein
LGVFGVVVVVVVGLVCLDIVLAERLRDELATLVERTRITTLLVTHAIEEAVRLADSILLLGGRPTEIISRIDIKTPRHAMTDAYAAEVQAQIGAIFANAS